MKPNVESILCEHPDYRRRREVLSSYLDLYAGGEQLKRNASRYLLRRQKEPAEVYGERLDRVFYENYVGSIVDWYAATLFRRAPLVQADGNSESGRKFLREFLEDCDARGTSVTSFFRQQFIQTLIYGTSYTLVDFPRSEAKFQTRAEEDQAGRARAYLVPYTPLDLVNWDCDARGRFSWVVFRSVERKRPNKRGEPERTVTTWNYYDKSSFTVYRSTGTVEGDGRSELVDSGAHALANLGIVPIFEMQVSEGLWLMNKAALLQIEHFNKSNSLSWAIAMSLFAMPVIYSDREWEQMLGDSYFIQLGPQDRFGWTEPEGKVYQIAADNLSRLKEEIYRVCYLMGQAGTSSTSAIQSGLSKLRDFAVTQEVLRAYGASVKDVVRRVLGAINEVRQDGLQITVQGLDDFDIADFGSDLADAQQLLQLGIPSPTLKRQVFRRLAQKYLSDASQDIKDQIAREIETQPEIK